MNLSVLLSAMIAVESGGNDRAVGDHRRAFGCLQIHACVVRDVNRIAGSSYTHRDAFNRGFSVRMATIYLNHWATKRRLGHDPTAQDYVRIWVGGPDGFRSPETLAHWNKVELQLTK